MKKRKPKIKDKKLRGEWAEAIFVVRASERGLQVSKPWGESRSYDFVVGRPGHFSAVQVKCTIHNTKNGSGYRCKMCHSRPYPPGAFDFLAAYLVFEDSWYIIPEKKVRGKLSISLFTQCNESRYEKYLEAWHLLERPSGGGIEIKACVEEFSSTWDELDLESPVLR